MPRESPRSRPFVLLLMALLAAGLTGFFASGCELAQPIDFKGTECKSCHLGDAEPLANHHNLLDITCSQCHNKTRFVPAIPHGASTLRGAHIKLACADCHQRPNPVPQTCITCHEKDYNGVKSPDHVALKHPKNCVVCHSQDKWTPATTVNHDQFFPLKNAHAGLDCTKCHVDNKFKGTPKTCVGCHQKDYDGTTNPAHKAGQFPTDCTQCHNDKSWRPATFNHEPFFPITAGNHAGLQCQNCHQNPKNYKELGCTTCHEHSKERTDPEHNGINGYRYESRACYECHPKGD